MTEHFYVYEHRRADTGEVFYVGKGTYTTIKKYIRARTHARRNQWWRRIVAKHGLIVDIYANTTSEALAFEIEKALIAQHGRLLDGGPLCNLTGGGEGHCGLSPSQETREKMAVHMLGTTRTKAQRLAVSLAQRGVPNPPDQNRAHSIRMSGPGNPKYGKKDSPETIAKRSASMKGKLAGPKHPFFGKPRPASVIAKMSGGNSWMARRVIDRSSGRIYWCAKDAAKACGVASSTMSRWLRGTRRNPTMLEFA